MTPVMSRRCLAHAVPLSVLLWCGMLSACGVL